MPRYFHQLASQFSANQRLADYVKYVVGQAHIGTAPKAESRIDVYCFIQPYEQGVTSARVVVNWRRIRVVVPSRTQRVESLDTSN